MTGVARIVEQAFREAGMLAENGNPAPAQAREAVARLDRIVAALYGHEVGEELTAWPIPGNHQPLPNTRLICNLAVPTAVDLPCTPEDGARIGVQDIQGNFTTCPLILHGNGRMIDGAPSLTLATSGTNAIWFYRADLCDWRRLSALTPDGEMPFPPEFDDYFVTALAMRLNPRYGTSIAPESAAILDRARERMRARYRQHRRMPVLLPSLHLHHREISL